MKIENIFRKIKGFDNITLDVVLFEAQYPVMFTCKNGGKIYLFICCLVNAEKMEWIGTRTTYDNLIDLLKNKVTIREAFLNTTENKIIIDYNGKTVNYKNVHKDNIPDKLLPTIGEYMDAEEGEYEKEINLFMNRNTNIEYLIRPRISSLTTFCFRGQGRFHVDDFLDPDFNMLEHKTQTIYKNQVSIV